MKALALVLALLQPPVLACAWDSDTLDDEIHGLPDAEALVVTGRWFRHGTEIYGKRVREIPARLAAEPRDLDAWDDLAVAHDRLGDPASALAVLEKKARVLESCPDEGHRYRLLANRGTVLSHAGRYDEAAADLEKAVAMNPASHFGRERFQIALVRYLAAARKDPSRWSSTNFLFMAGPLPTEGYGLPAEFFPGPPCSAPPDAPTCTWKEAYAGVVGLLRTGGPEAAELWRTLGDLLYERVEGHGRRNLAWWAWHRALDLGHPARPALRARIEDVETYWERAGLLFPPSERDFARMKENGEAWPRNLQEAEAGAIRRGEETGTAEAAARFEREAAGRTPSPPGTGHFSMAAFFSERRLPGNLLLLFALAGIGLLLARDAWRRKHGPGLLPIA